MKKKVILAFVFFINLCVFASVYAQESKTKNVVQTVDSYADSIKNNEYVSKTTSMLSKGWGYVQSGWNGFKKWFSKLPGIKQYNESVYAGDNWKRTMGSMGNEYSPHLKKDSAGVNMLREGKKKWDNL